MACDDRLQPQELHHRPHRVRRAVRHVAGPRRRAAQRRPCAALHGPLPDGDAGRGLLRHRGDGQARGARARPVGQHRDGRGGVARPRAAARRDRRRAGDRVHRRRQAPLGQLNFAAEKGVEVRARRPARTTSRARSSSSRRRPSRSAPRTSTSARMRASYVRNALAARRRGLRAHSRRHRVPGRRHEHPTRTTVEATLGRSSRRPEMVREDTFRRCRAHLAGLTDEQLEARFWELAQRGRRPAGRARPHAHVAVDRAQRADAHGRRLAAPAWRWSASARSAGCSGTAPGTWCCTCMQRVGLRRCRGRGASSPTARAGTSSSAKWGGAR